MLIRQILPNFPDLLKEREGSTPGGKLSTGSRMKSGNTLDTEHLTTPTVNRGRRTLRTDPPFLNLLHFYASTALVHYRLTVIPQFHSAISPHNSAKSKSIGAYHPVMVLHIPNALPDHHISLTELATETPLTWLPHLLPSLHLHVTKT